MTTTSSAPLKTVITKFKRIGLLLESDGHLPSVTSLVAGEPIKGSWWGHPKGREIWRVLNAFTERKDVLITKLVSGKVTFLYRPLWNDFIAIAISKEKWQMRHLSPRAKRLLQIVEKSGSIRTDLPTIKVRFIKIGDPSRELERRLLIHSGEVHTEKGSHAKILETWPYWSARSKLESRKIDPELAKARFEVVVNKLNKRYNGKGSLPWMKKAVQ